MNNHYSMGGCGDSFYEYRVKNWIAGQRDDDAVRAMDEGWEGMQKLLMRRCKANRLLLSGQVQVKRFLPFMEELTCFLPGTLLLYLQSHNDTSTQQESLRSTAKSLLFTCFMMANSTRSGLPPENAVFSDTQGIIIRKNSKHYTLRPETIESLFYLKELEHDPIAQEWGWILYQAIERHCRVEDGYAMFSDVEGDGKPEDSIESYFPGETLKYLYLLFKAESIVDLQKVVLTTEAHIIPIH